MTYLGFAIVGVIFSFTIIAMRFKMKRTARFIERSRLSSGGMVRHGMVFDSKRGVGVVGTTAKSDRWYRRLME
jgi:hypothetical protein